MAAPEAHDDEAVGTPWSRLPSFSPKTLIRALIQRTPATGSGEHPHFMLNKGGMLYIGLPARPAPVVPDSGFDAAEPSVKRPRIAAGEELRSVEDSVSQ